MNRALLMTSLSLLTALLFAASLLTGPAGLGIAAGTEGLFAGGNEAASVILREIRLPRALLGLATGFALGLSGAALQGYLRNPLAEPGLIGISGLASLGAVLIFYSGLAGSSLYALPAGALAGAALAVLILLAIARASGSTLTLILAGVALSSLAGALTSLVLNLSPNPFAAYEIIFWLLGSLKDRSLVHAAIALPLIGLGSVLLFATARALDALSLGEESAASLGVSVPRTRILIVTGVALSVGATAAIAGSIGFIGLVVPHLIRPLTSRLPGSLLLPSALGGASLLLAADIAVRLVIPGRELNVGVFTALIGAPFFLWLVMASRRETA